MSFPNAATGNPVNTKRRVAFQPTNGVPVNDGAAYVDFLTYGGPITLDPSVVDRLALSGSGAPKPPLPGKIPVVGGPFANGDADPANRGLMRFLASLYGKHDFTDNTTWQLWDFNLDGATSNDQRLCLLNDNDVLWRQRFFDLLITGLQVSASANDNLAVEFPFVCANVDFFGVPTQTAGTGSDLPALKGFSTGNTALPEDTADYDIFIRVDSISGDDITISVKIGTGSAYSNSQVVTAGQWNRLQDESGARIGLYASQAQVYWDTGFTLTALDEFQIPASMDAWTPTLATDRPIASVNTAFILDGEEIRVEGGWNVDLSWSTAEVRPDVSGKLGGNVRRAGELTATITPTRDLADVKLQRKILHADEVSLVIDAFTDVEIPSASRPYRFLQVFPALRPSGQMFGTEPGGENLDESFVLTAGEPATTFNYDGMTFDSHAHVVIENDVATL